MEKRTTEELLIALDYENTELSTHAAQVIRSLKRDIEMAYIEIEHLNETLDQLK